MRFSRCCVSALVLLSSTPAFAFFPGTPVALVRPTISRSAWTASRPSELHALPQQTPEVAREAVGNLISFFDSINTQLTGTFQSTLSEFLETLTKSANEITHLADKVDPKVLSVLSEASDKVSAALQELLTQNPALQPAFDTVQSQLRGIPGLGSAPAPVLVLVSSVVTYTVVSSILSVGMAPPPSNPYPLKRYDPAAARAYFDARFPLVVKRGLEIATASLGFGLSVLKDYVG
jgi:hypothetical protein